MDPLSHFLITRKLISTERNVTIAGLAPDIPFYATYPAWIILQGSVQKAFSTNEWPDPPNWMKTCHHIFHSLPVVLFIMIVVRLLKGHWPLWGVAWVVHILIDIPTHARKYWAPKFLWPLSNVTVDGISWPKLLVAIVHKLLDWQKEKKHMRGQVGR